MNIKTKTTFTIVSLLAAVVLTGTVMGTQYVSAGHHGRGHHGGYGMAMATSTGHRGHHGGYGMAIATSSGGGMSNGGGGSSSGSSGGGY